MPALFRQLANLNHRIVRVLSEDEAARLESLLGRVVEQVKRIHAEGDGVAQCADRWRGGRRQMARLPLHNVSSAALARARGCATITLPQPS